MFKKQNIGELEQALWEPEYIQAWQLSSAVVDLDFVPPTEQAVDQDFEPGWQSNWDLNSTKFQDPSII